MSTDFKYQVVIQLPASKFEDFDQLIALDEELFDAMLALGHCLDGHDFGSGTMNLFIHTNKPEAAFLSAKQHFSEAEQQSLKAAFRAFDTDDFIWLQPADSVAPFELW